MSPVTYELGFYIPEDDILHSRRRETLNLTEIPVLLLLLLKRYSCNRLLLLTLGRVVQ
jgi:hypothetical protein